MSGAFSMQVADCERNIRIQFEKLQQENQSLKDRIEMAIEYINNHTIEWVDEKFKENNIMVKFDEYSNPQALLEIIKGDK